MVSARTSAGCFCGFSGATIFRLDACAARSNWEAKNRCAGSGHMNWEYYNERYAFGCGPDPNLVLPGIRDFPALCIPPQNPIQCLLRDVIRFRPVHRHRLQSGPTLATRECVYRRIQLKEIYVGRDRLVRREVRILCENARHHTRTLTEPRPGFNMQEFLDRPDHARLIVVVRVGHAAADVWAYSKGHRAMTVHMVEAILGVILNHEDQRLRPETGFRDSFDNPRQCEVVVRNHGSGRRCAGFGSICMIGVQSHDCEFRKLS